MQQNKIIIVLLVISLFFNVYVLARVNELREFIAHDFKYYSERVYGKELDEIMDAIDEMKRDQQWISDVDIQYGGIVNDKQLVKFSWQMKDYTPGADVSFYYRESGEADFKQLAAESQTAGNFTAELELDREEEPEWIVTQEYERRENNVSDTVTVKNLSGHEYEYYVSVDDGNRIISSEVISIGLGKIVREYAAMEAELYIGKENRPSYVELYWDEGKTKPDKIILEIHEKSKLTETELDINKGHMAEWKSSGTDFDKLTVKVKYENGKEFRKDIWSTSQP